MRPRQRAGQLTGATVAYAVWPRRVFHATEVAAVREALLPLVLIQLLFSFLPGISWGAHLGGFLFGLLAATSGLLHLGLPDRADKTRLAPISWFRVAANCG